MPKIRINFVDGDCIETFVEEMDIFARFYLEVRRTFLVNDKYVVNPNNITYVERLD